MHAADTLHGDTRAAGRAVREPGTGAACCPPVISTATELRDAQGVFLGYVVSSNADGLEVFTPKGYLVSMSWAGTLQDGIALFTEPSGKGTVFVQWSNAYPLQGYVTVIKGKPYIAASLNAEGNAVADPGITSYQSYYFDGTTNDMPGNARPRILRCLPAAAGRAGGHRRAFIGIPAFEDRFPLVRRPGQMPG